MFQIFENCRDGYDSWHQELEGEVFVTQLEAEERCDELDHLSAYQREYFVQEVLLANRQP